MKQTMAGLFITGEVKRVLALVAGVSLGIGALQCTSAPKASCRDGSTKVSHDSRHGTQTYHCRGGQWVRDK
jgi:hypothetical protein